MTSLVTRCPACGTLFKVVPDQLRISEGWVRCGQCDEVFDAQAQMQSHIVVLPDAAASSDAVKPEPMPQAAAGEPTLGHEIAAGGGVDDAAPAAAGGDVVLPAEEDPVLDSATLQGQDVEVADAQAEPLPERPMREHEDATTGPAVDVVPLVPDEAMADVSDVLPRFEQSPPAAETVDTQAFQASFLKPVSTVPSGRLRWLYRAMVPLLTLLLVLQMLVQQRDRIAATEPALAGVLNVLCQPFGCEVTPLRQIESIVIESSSFIKVKADVYRLSFSIKNTALVPLALPFAELALTDLRDQSVLRRVLAPTEYGARAETLGPGDELVLVVPVAVKATGAASDKVTGYRLLVFYP